MNTDSRNSKNPYFSVYFRMLMALMVANYIILDGQQKPIIQVIQQKNFYITLVFSFTIAMFLLECLHHITLLLDKKFTWRYAPIRRLLLQIVLGVILLLYVDIWLVKGFFHLFNYDFKASGYMLIEFPKVKWLLMVMNFLYWLEATAPGTLSLSRFLSTKTLSRDEYNAGEEEELINKVNKVEALRGRLGNKIEIISFDKIACLKCESLTGYIYLKDNSIFNMDYKMNDLEQILDPQRFFRTNRGVIYAFDVIEHHRRERKEGLLTLYSGINPDATRIISRDRYMDFKYKFSQFRSGETGKNAANVQ
ncbi:LytTR family DNA-binding domain-containing protein [Pedobacter aquatilis]|uniref:LytTR family DNA-binding domain-containing protein n=1 Tax=Pedobacter aquatilis TaxID=351343 RepID=UPI0029315233|nr:LytTR family DNA-binding domain-containing protein [Pedobacter aquatilis]